MKRSRRLTRRMDAQPLWLRRVAALCVLLTAFIGTAQAVHIHGEWLPKAAHSLHQPSVSPETGGEEHCPLCVAMHSTLPVEGGVAPLHLHPLAEPVPSRAVERASSAVHFALFSRPPPTSSRS